MAKSIEDVPAGAKTDSCIDTVEARGMRVDMAVTLLCAARYAMGRRSYAPGCVISVLRKNLHILNKCQREALAKEIRQESEWNEKWKEPSLGHDSVRPAWEWTDWLALAGELESKGTGD